MFQVWFEGRILNFPAPRTVTLWAEGTSCVFVGLQAKAEEVDLSNPAPMSDNLIDFTDPTPVVRFSQLHVDNSSLDVI